jgi:hypothetical protein
MADRKSTSLGGFTHSRRKAASRIDQQEGPFRSTEGNFDQNWNIVPKEGRYTLAKKRKRHVFQGPSNSEKSSNVTRQSSVASKTGYRTSMDVVQAAGTPPYQNVKMKNSDISSQSGPSSPDLLLDYSTNHLDSQDAGTPPIDIQRPTSPRIRMSIFYGEESHLFPTTQVGAMFPVPVHVDEKEDSEGHPALDETDEGRIHNLRTKALKLRSRIRSGRRELLAKQRAKSLADEAFMKYIREHRPVPQAVPSNSLGSPASTSGNSVLEAHYTAMQAARNDYGPVEDEYNLMEEELDEIDYELATLEAHSTKRGAKRNSDYVPTQASKRPPSPESFFGLSDTLEKSHPLKAELLSRLGDLDLATEQLQNLQHEREQLLAVQESRSSLGLEVSEYEKAFLADFPAVEAALRGEIGELEEDIEQIKSKCLEAGVDISESSSGSYEGSSRNTSEEPVGETEESGTSWNDLTLQQPGDYNLTTPRGELGLAFRTAKISDGSIDVKRHSVLNTQYKPAHTQVLDKRQESVYSSPESLYSMFPLLLPNSDKGKADLDVLITEFEEKDKNDRINRWMLHKLQTSYYEVDLLLRVFFEIAKIVDFRHWPTGTTEWELCVLLYWKWDKANKPADFVKTTQTSSSVIRSPVSVTKSTPVHTNSSRGPTSLHPISESGPKVRSASASVDRNILLKGIEILRKCRSCEP